MRSRDYYEIIGETLKQNPLRSFLTVLSIIIGVFSIILLSAVSHAARGQVLASVEKIGSKLIFVLPGKANSITQFRRSSIYLNSETVKRLERIPGISGMVPQSATSATISYKDKNLNTYVYGVTPNFLSVREYKMLKGYSFDPGNPHTTENVCILGNNVYKEFYDGEELVGKSLYIGPRGSLCRIIGILAEKGQNMTVDQDDRIYVPLSYFQKKLFISDEIGLIYVKVKEEQNIKLIKSLIKTELEDQYGKDSENFNVKSQSELLESLGIISDTFTTLILMVALISLVVGGIGIMNIMLISVNERTKEIGIRKSVGAQRSHIELQFLLEAVVLTGLGGIFGIVLAYLVGGFLAVFLSWKMYFPPGITVLAFIVSVIIGLVFGYFPARRAARIPPAETLREL